MNIICRPQTEEETYLFRFSVCSEKGVHGDEETIIKWREALPENNPLHRIC